MKENKIKKKKDIYLQINKRLNIEQFNLNKNNLENNIIEHKFVNKKNVIFSYEDFNYNFICDEDELLYSLIEKFKERTDTKNLNLLFLYNGKQLNPIITINQLDSLPDIKINVFTLNYLTGRGLPIKFTDLSKQFYEEHYFSDSAPSYRIVMQGINIYGICKNKKCIAYKKEVIFPLSNKKRLDLIEEKYDLECPECGNIINPKTVGFYLCNYKIKGVKFQDDKKEHFEFEGQAPKKDCIQYFNPDKNGETTIVELIIEVTEYLI